MKAKLLILTALFFLASPQPKLQASDLIAAVYYDNVPPVKKGKKKKATLKKRSKKKANALSFLRLKEKGALEEKGKGLRIVGIIFLSAGWPTLFIFGLMAFLVIAIASGYLSPLAIAVCVIAGVGFLLGILGIIFYRIGKNMAKSKSVK